MNTLQASRAAARPTPRSGLGRFAIELALLVGLVFLLYWLVALLSYSPQDAAWSTSGTGGLVSNRAGRAGAWLADGSYFLFGFSVWWFPLVGVQVWLTTLAQRLRGQDDPALNTARPSSVLARLASSRLAFWLGLVLLISASSAVVWTRFYRLQAHLPGPGSGMLGDWIG